MPVYGPARESIAGVVHAVADGDEIHLPAPANALRVLEVLGHTAGHVAYVGMDIEPGLVFCGDTLFSAGCGRLFEGTPAQLGHSLARLAALPPDTRVYCTHEYTLSNLPSHVWPSPITPNAMPGPRTARRCAPAANPPCRAPSPASGRSTPSCAASSPG